MKNKKIFKNNGVLKIYNPPVLETCNGDVLKYAEYISDFEKSYKIVSINGIPMIIVDDDRYPIIIDEEKQDKFIHDYEMTRKLVNNTWMNRYR